MIDDLTAEELMRKFVEPGADYGALTKDLRPTDEDYAAFFKEEFVEEAKVYYEKMWTTMPPEGGLGPKPGQTEFKLFAATPEDFAMQSQAAGSFPGGYSKVYDKLQPGITVYAFKFVEPGNSSGMAFNGLAHLNGHWVIFPKPYRALRT